MNYLPGLDKDHLTNDTSNNAYRQNRGSGVTEKGFKISCIALGILNFSETP